ncbi:hypothetical protein LUZ60_005647 [Juncus effusus]|nr:hypothetical protein LUZ60_005647 [Juncus effusus]
MNPEIDFISISETESSDESDFFAIEDDSDEDPTFDLIQESLSKLSIKKKKPRDEEEIEISYLDENGGKSFESIENLIHEGKLEKLKMEDYRTYLKRYGLRLTGNKEVLQERVQKHLEVKDGRGERKYPISSFIFNCKGDACTGDVVMFTQFCNKLDKKESEKAKVPQTRLVVGRIIRESYGAEKQQHTFTIEVLWSRGKKPLPPLYPLRIKGRNLYKLKTLRQKWENEDERDKVLKEKHDRGHVARVSREIRIQERERRIRERENIMVQRQNRMPVRSQKQHGAAPVINPRPKLQERTNFTSNYNRIEIQANPNNQRGPQIRLGPPPYSNPNTNTSIRSVDFDQVNHFQRPVHIHRGGGLSDRWDPYRQGNNGYVGDFSDRWDPRREEVRREYGGPGPRLNCGPGPLINGGPGAWYNGGPRRREMCRDYVRGKCRYGRECKYSHDER